MSPTLDRALGLLRRGDPDGARALVATAVEEAAHSDGPASLAHAAACEDRAAIALALGDPQAAAEAYRDAIRLEVIDDRTAVARSRCLLALSQLLARLGEPVEAERAAREAAGLARAGSTLVARARVALARLLVAREQDAAEVARAALDALWGHPEAAEALVVHALAATAAGRSSDLELYLDSLPDGSLREVVRAALELSEAARPAHVAPVLLRLAGYLRARRSPVDEDAVRLLVAATNLGPDQDPRGWIAAFRALVAALRKLGRGPEAARAALGLASACARIADPVTAEIAYEAALRDAERAGDPGVLADVLRAYGLYLAADARPEEADPVLRRAIAAAPAAGRTLGRSLVAHGLVLSHAGREEEARDQLEQGLALLPDDDDDAIRAAVHLDALATGRGCGCGSSAGVTGAILRVLVLRDAPAGLLSDLALESRDGKPHVKLIVDRDPAAGELERVDSVIRGALPVALRLGSPR